MSMKKPNGLQIGDTVRTKDGRVGKLIAIREGKYVVELDRVEMVFESGEISKKEMLFG